jgi:hypothetical protein
VFLDNMTANKGPSVLEPLGDISNQHENAARPVQTRKPESDEARKETTQARLVDLLESTLWNRRLAPSSEVGDDLSLFKLEELPNSECVLYGAFCF